MTTDTQPKKIEKLDNLLKSAEDALQVLRTSTFRLKHGDIDETARFYHCAMITQNAGFLHLIAKAALIEATAVVKEFNSDTAIWPIWPRQQEHTDNQETQKKVALRLAALKVRSGLSWNKISAAAGYAKQSSMQRYYTPGASKKPYLPHDLIETLLQIMVGKGDPPITREEILSLAPSFKS